MDGFKIDGELVNVAVGMLRRCPGAAEGWKLNNSSAGAALALARGIPRRLAEVAVGCAELKLARGSATARINGKA